MPQIDLRQAALLTVAAEFCFAAMGVAIKSVSAELSTAMIVFVRSAIMIAVLGPWLSRAGQAGLRTRRPWLHLLRGLAGVSAMFCFFYAIAHIPLAQAWLLKLSAPLFIPLIALAWLREPVGARVALAVTLGFVGVYLVLAPGGAQASPVAWIALAGGAFAAVAKTSIRRLSSTEPAARTVFYFGVVSTVVSAPFALSDCTAPSPTGWLWLVMIVAFATAGQLLMTRAFAHAPAGSVGPFAYSSVVFASLWGDLLWDETPGPWTIAGAALIVAAGWVLLRSRGPLRRTVAEPAPGSGAV